MFMLKGRLLKDDAEYNELRANAKKIVNVMAIIFALTSVVFGIAAIAIFFYMGNSYDFFPVFYISFAFCAFVSAFIFLLIICGSYDKSCVHLDNGKYSFSVSIIVVFMIILISIAAYCFTMFIISYVYCMSIWNMPAPLFICIFSLVITVFNATIFAACIIWLVRWRFSWEELTCSNRIRYAKEEAADSAKNEFPLTDKLFHLKKLYEDNLISKEEYETMRIELLKKYVQK